MSFHVRESASTQIQEQQPHAVLTAKFFGGGSDEIVIEADEAKAKYLEWAQNPRDTDVEDLKLYQYGVRFEVDTSDPANELVPFDRVDTGAVYVTEHPQQVEDLLECACIPMY